LDLLHLIHSHNSGLQAIQRYRYSTHFFAVAQALGFSVLISRVLSLHLSPPGNGFITVSLALQTTREVFFAPSNSSVAIILQLPIPKTRLDSNPLLPSSYPRRLAFRLFTLDYSASTISSDVLCPFIISRNRPHGKHPSIVKEECLPVRYLAMDVLLSRARVLAGMCLPSRCLAMGVHVTISNIY
jgi:hypothetical protein